MNQRILTPQQRLEHIGALKAEDPNHPDAYFELVGDIATVNSNRRHNPESGFYEFLPDTPGWIIELARS